MDYILENSEIKIKVSSYGAELCDIINKSNGLSYMWDAGEAWKRHSPVLFPIVGGIKDKTYKLDGKEYHLNQHGFARDMEFTLSEKTDNSISFTLTSNVETKELFPCDFILTISYIIEGSKITVGWKVENPADTEMYFQIGGHPAFTCPLKDESQTDCYLHFDENGPLEYNLLSGNGLCLNPFYKLETDNGYVKFTHEFFDKDALVFYNDRERSVSLAGSDKQIYLKVTFDAPVYGIWSAKGKHAPFVCIEPWYGRCDDDDYSGIWQDRKFMNRLAAKEVFDKTYTIEII